MTNVVWLASYPKSGNTWMRILLRCLSLGEGEAIDINRLSHNNSIASARAPFEFHTLIDSGLLTHDEIDCLRPLIHEILASEPFSEDAPEAAQPVRFVKTHDAYSLTPLGEPLLAGARGARGAVLIVRDPRDVAPSLANHRSSTIDTAIDFMNDVEATFSGRTDRQARQFRQKLPGWSGHVLGWLDQRDIPVHVLRYEDLKRDTVGAMSDALRLWGWHVPREALERAAALAAFDKLQVQERTAGFAEWLADEGSDSLFFRRGETGAWRDELTPQQVARIEAAHGPVMTRLGYELTADLHLAPEEGRRA